MAMPRKIRCAVDAITDHGGRVYTIDLKPQSPVPPFLPGQFLHLTVDEYDPASFWPESRVFSIASSPRDRSRIRICYSVKGRYTEKMERTLRVGGDVWIKLPYGEFVIDNTRDAVLIAGGTGISAFTAFIEALVPVHPTSNSLLKDTLHPHVAAPDKAWPDDLRGFSRDGHRLSAAATVFHGADSPSLEGSGVGSSPASPPPRVTLLYGARTPDLWLFREMIERQVAACPQFSAMLFAESDLQDTPETRSRAEAASQSLILYLPGRISIDPLFAARGLYASTSGDGRPSKADCPLSTDNCPLFYLSGPPAMLSVFGGELQARGIPPDQIRTDAWE